MGSSKSIQRLVLTLGLDRLIFRTYNIVWSIDREFEVFLRVTNETKWGRYPYQKRVRR